MKSFKTSASLLVLLMGLTSLNANETIQFGSGANQFEMDFVAIGNPGNKANTQDFPFDAGSVGYNYNVAKYEVSRDMVTKGNAIGNLGLTLDPMTTVTGGPRPQMPATGLSWNEAARFVNWLNTSQGYGPAYKTPKKPGGSGYDPNAEILRWQKSDVGYDAANPTRNLLARYFLPTDDELVKAAYYDPNANGGAGGYWDYPTGSNAPPTAVSDGTAPGTAVYLQSTQQGPADIKNAGGLSPYGVMSIGGNVEELEENLILDNIVPARYGVRGGHWSTTRQFQAFLDVTNQFDLAGSGEYAEVGFRVVSIPEPTGLTLAAFSLLSATLMTRKRRS